MSSAANDQANSQWRPRPRQGRPSLTVTTAYLRRLEGQEDLGWGRVAEAIGV
jgi:hypothetical protein